MRSISASTSNRAGVDSFPGAAPRRPSRAWGGPSILGHFAELDGQVARRDQTRDLRIAEFVKQSEDIAVYRFLPGALPRREVAADQRSVNARVEGRAVKREQTSLGKSRHADHRVLEGPCGGPGFFFREPVDGRQDLLHLVTDDVLPHFIGLPVNPFAVRLVGETLELRVARPGVLAIDEDRHNHLASVFGQASCELRLARQAWCEADQHLRRLIGIG